MGYIKKLLSIGTIWGQIMTFVSTIWTCFRLVRNWVIHFIMYMVC